ncbi:MAG: TspO/MBR family protein [Bacteroidia bacterium]
MRLLFCLLLPLMIGGFSGYLSASGVNDWYLTINKPSFNPPSWVFGPVWTTLYLVMGYSLYLVLKTEPSQTRTLVISLFAVQITLNFLWSLIFFRWHMLGLAFVEIVILWLCILLMAVKMHQISSLAAWLQVPYLLWVGFASLLSGSLWWLNR